MARYDSSSKLLFSHKQMARDLIRGFIKQGWASGVDLDTLERVNASYVSDDLKDRADDLVWKVRWTDPTGKHPAGQWLYIYLLLEFQSTVEYWMALRVHVYKGLLYQDIIRSEAYKAGQKLPRVFAVVLYNGDAPWTAPTDIADLVMDSPDEGRLSGGYTVIDEKHGNLAELQAMRNVVAAMFRLWKCRRPGDVVTILDQLQEWITEPQRESLLRAFATWIQQILLPTQLQGIELAPAKDLQEVRTMIAEQQMTWIDWARLEGRQEGERTVLLRQLERRFGALDERTQQQIAAADSDTLLEWSDRVLTAQHLEDVLAS